MGGLLHLVQIDGCAVTFGTERRGLGEFAARQELCSMYQM